MHGSSHCPRPRLSTTELCLRPGCDLAPLWLSAVGSTGKTGAGPRTRHAKGCRTGKTLPLSFVPLPSRLRHRLCLVLPLPSCTRHCLCLAVLRMASRPRAKLDIRSNDEFIQVTIRTSHTRTSHTRTSHTRTSSLPPLPNLNHRVIHRQATQAIAAVDVRRGPASIYQPGCFA